MKTKLDKKYKKETKWKKKERNWKQKTITEKAWKKKKEEWKHEKNKDGYKNIKNNTTKRERVKREMSHTARHGRDIPRVPIGDVLIKCWS